MLPKEMEMIERNTPENRIVEAVRRGVRCLIVRGAAGTGKTTLVRNLIPALRESGFSPSLLAPTGRAALMLKKRTGHSASTIHSAIYNINDEPLVNDQGEALKWIFPLRVEDDIENTVFVVDEASMIGLAKHESDRELLQFGSGSLLGDLVEFSGITVPNTTNVLIFVGDPFQLPPVQESSTHIPPALNETRLAELVRCPVEVIELQTVYRQKAGSGILAEASKIRDCLIRRDFNYFRCASHEDVIVVGADRFLDSFDPHWDLDDKIVVAHTNLRVDEYNVSVRRKLGLTMDLPQVGERLLSLRNTQVMTSSGMKIGFLNGDFLRVEGVDAKSFRLQGFYSPKGKEKRYHFEFTWCRMEVSWVYEPERRKTETIWVNVTPILSRDWNAYPEYASVALYNGVRANIERQLHAVGKSASRETVKRLLKESALLHAPIVKFGYAVTGHKSQGGEWKQVWVDYVFGASPVSEYFFRWAYTATTRASECLHAICPPDIDMLTVALGRNAVPASAPSVGGVGGQTVLDELLAKNGFSASSVVEMDWCKRVVLTRGGLLAGHVDFRYRKNGVITCVDVRVPLAEDDLRTGLLAFAGRDIRIVMEQGRTDVAPVFGRQEDGGEALEAVIERLPEAYQSVLRRIRDAASVCGMELRGVQSMTQWQIRLVLGSPRGGGHFDLYFKGNGRLSYCSNGTLPPEDLSVIRQTLEGR